MNDRIAVTLTDGVADVRLNRPDRKNALDAESFAAIRAAINDLAAMPGLRCVVLSGAGGDFCAGIDLAMLSGGHVPDLMARSHGPANALQQAAWGWRTLPVPVIAAIGGVALGAGFQIALAADIRIAAPDARLSVMEARWGLVPDLGGMALYRGVIRDDVMRDLTYSGRVIAAAEAVVLGVVTRIAADPLAEAMALALTIAANSPRAVRAAKRLFNDPADQDAGAILIAESDEQQMLLAGPDHAETLLAAREGRRPTFVD